MTDVCMHLNKIVTLNAESKFVIWIKKFRYLFIFFPRIFL